MIDETATFISDSTRPPTIAVLPSIAAYGTWSSPITSAALTEAAVGLSQVQVWGDRVWWIEARPSESGRQVIVAAPIGDNLVGDNPAGDDPVGGDHPRGRSERGRLAVTDRLPVGFSARTQVHEYGGRCYAGYDDVVLWSNWDDQRLWVRRGDEEPVALTATSDPPRAVRYADPVISPDRAWVICVRERHTADEVVNDLVAIPLTLRPAAGGESVRVLAAGADFYAAPRLSPAGDRLAWLSWDHPDMPWDHTELYEAPFAGGAIGPARLVAGQGRESITQPRWSPDATLHYLSDRTGWWNVYADGDQARCPLDAEFGGPDWAFGESTYAFLPDGRLVVTWSSEGPGRLGVVGPSGLTALDLAFSSFSSMAAFAGGIVVIAGAPTVAPTIVRIGVDDGSVHVLRTSNEVPVDPGGLSRPQAVTFPSGGEQAHAWYYPPTNLDFVAPDGEKPPLVVMSHGGPTGAASSVLNLAVQYWTSRGFAVADVDYRGSSGYGRAYRDRLRGAWGIVDVEDCAAVVSFLVDQGLVDGSRAVIRGGSAGGFTTLATLAFTDTFAAGASHYGVADLELLARDTHKFEARYLDGLVGPWPADAARYQQRSPLYHLDNLRCPIILFQGDEDKVVPRSQADAIYAALQERGVPVAYLVFAGEQHGFRQAATIKTVADAELAFYGRVLGFTPAGAPTVPPIANAERLAPEGPRHSEG